MRIVAQEDQPTALADLTSLALYVLRMLIHVHVWSFRAPDIPKPRDRSNAFPVLCPDCHRR